MTGLSPEELTRYSRHIFLKEVGREGQERLSRARVSVVGAGGLGSPVLMYLAAAGVGDIVVVDDDRLELSNLQRQTLYTEKDLGRPKAEAAADRIQMMNKNIRVQPIVDRFGVENAEGLLRGSDLLIETTDNFPSKFLSNDVAVLTKTPAILAGILRFEGQLLLVNPGASACYRCIFREPPPANAVPSCSEAGVLGAVAGVVGAMQAIEALKWLLGIGEAPTGRLQTFAFLESTIRKVSIQQDPECPVCSDSGTIRKLAEENYVPHRRGHVRLTSDANH